MAAGLTGREIGFLAGGLTIGGGAGYLLTKRALEAKYEQVALETVREEREILEARKVAAEPKPDLNTLATDLGYKRPEYTPEEQEAINEVAAAEEAAAAPVVKNIFEEAAGAAEFSETPVWDYKVEIDRRDPTKPYVIHKDEFEELEEHEQASFTYFAGDDVLCDERDAVVDDRDNMIGDENLERFGHGSEDPNVVYIRNEVLGMDFEINKSEGLYAQEVHGFSPEDLQHSAIRRRPQRDFDES